MIARHDVTDDESPNLANGDIDLVLWLTQLALHEPERYARLRDIAWFLVAANTERVVVPN